MATMIPVPTDSARQAGRAGPPPGEFEAPRSWCEALRVPDSHDVPADPAGLPDAPALPEGVEEFPDWGPGAIGTRFRDGALPFYRILSIVLGLLAVATLVAFAPAYSQSIGALLIALVLAALLALSAVNYHRIAGHGTVRPAVVLTADRLEVLVPFNRFSVDLAAVRDVTLLSRDLIVLAPGGVHNRGKASSARRAVINNIRSFTVERAHLAKLIEERARAVSGRG